MKIKKDFIAKIAIGIKGVAVMEFSETLSPDSNYSGSDIEPNLVLNTIMQYGLGDWVRYLLNDVPSEPGVYRFRGTAEFNEDDADYNVTCSEMMQTSVSLATMYNGRGK